MATNRKAYYILRIVDRDYYNMSKYEVLARAREFYNARDILREKAQTYSNDFVILVEETDLHHPPPRSTTT